MKPLLFAILFSSASFFAAGQRNSVELSSEYSSDNELVIKAKKYGPGTYYLEVIFTELENSLFSDRIFTKVLKSGEETLMRLAPMNKEEYPHARYSYKYWSGNPECQPDSSFVYRLPFSEPREVRALSLFGRNYAHRTNVGWHAMQFIMEPGDTIYAARAGTVVELKENAEESAPQSGRITFSKKINAVTVEHADGTLAIYSVLKDPMVAAGAKIYPNTPLVYFPRLSVKKYPTDSASFEYHYFQPVFATDSGIFQLTMGKSYRPVISTELITREMTKREARRYPSK